MPRSRGPPRAARGRRAPGCTRRAPLRSAYRRYHGRLITAQDTHSSATGMVGDQDLDAPCPGSRGSPAGASPPSSSSGCAGLRNLLPALLTDDLARSPRSVSADRGLLDASGALRWSPCVQLSPSRKMNFSLLIEVVDQLLGRVAQRPEQDGGRQLPAAIDTNIEDVLGVELEVDPGAAVGDDPGARRSSCPMSRRTSILLTSKKMPGER